MELPGKAVRKSSYWNRQIFYACCVLVLMAVAFTALYCGVLYGLKDDTGKPFVYFKLNFLKGSIGIEMKFVFQFLPFSHHHL